jgi:hypothetical protein
VVVLLLKRLLDFLNFYGDDDIEDGLDIMVLNGIASTI